MPEKKKVVLGKIGDFIKLTWVEGSDTIKIHYLLASVVVNATVKEGKIKYTYSESKKPVNDIEPNVRTTVTQFFRGMGKLPVNKKKEK